MNYKVLAQCLLVIGLVIGVSTATFYGVSKLFEEKHDRVADCQKGFVVGIQEVTAQLVGQPVTPPEDVSLKVCERLLKKGDK